MMLFHSDTAHLLSGQGTAAPAALVSVLVSAFTTAVVMGGSSPASGENLVGDEEYERDQKYVFHFMSPRVS